MTGLRINGKCTECDPCTHHIWDESKKAWIRCTKSDPSVFFPQLLTLPTLFSNASWDSFQVKNANYKAAIDAAKTVVDRIVKGVLPKKSLLFTGHSNEELVLIATIILKELILKNFNCCFISFSDVISRYFEKREEYSDLYFYDVLVIHMGQEIVNTASPIILRDIFRERFIKARYTIFTSLFYLSDFPKRYGNDAFEYFASDKFKELILK